MVPKAVHNINQQLQLGFRIPGLRLGKTQGDEGRMITG